METTNCHSVGNLDGVVSRRKTTRQNAHCGRLSWPETLASACIFQRSCDEAAYERKFPGSCWFLKGDLAHCNFVCRLTGYG